MTYTDAEGVAHESYREYVEDLVGLCGCRNEEIVDDLVTILGTYLENAPVYFRDLPVVGPEKYVELLLHVLDNADLIEHGIAIRGSWLTDKGKVVAQRLRDES